MALFVSIEGFDGVGKTTQANLLYESLQNKGIPSNLVREPGGTVVAEKIRDILINNSELSESTELLLFEAARSDLVNNVISNKLRQGQVVITDRYIDSTLAYQGYGRNMEISLINQLNEISTSNLLPDITFLLDLDVYEAKKRTDERNIKEEDQIVKFENEEHIFHKRVREGFLKIASENMDRIVVIDSSLSRIDISKLILEKVLKKLTPDN